MATIAECRKKHTILENMAIHGKYGIVVNLDDEKWLSNINFCIGGNWLRPYCLVTKATAGKYATARDNSKADVRRQIKIGQLYWQTMLPNKICSCDMKYCPSFYRASFVGQIGAWAIFVGQQTANAALWLAVDISNMEESVWTDEECIVLIQFYEANPCLYLTTHTDYRNRDKKRVFENEIAAILMKPGETYASIHSACCQLSVGRSHEIPHRANRT